MKKRIAFTAYFALCFAMMLCVDALAYIDPATTSYLLQIIAGVFIACGATVAVFWRRITFYFKKKKAERVRAQREKAGK